MSETNERAERWWQAFLVRAGIGYGTALAAVGADAAVAEYEKRFHFAPTLDAAMAKASDEEIGKLRALVLRGTGLADAILLTVCSGRCDASSPDGPIRHVQACINLRQWLADCKAEGLE
jgi:hypothetical protein